MSLRFLGDSFRSMGTSSVSFAIEADGAAHVYVALTGNDVNPGTLVAPLRTVQKAVDLTNIWLEQHQKRDLVIHWGDGVYAENVKQVLPCIPWGRVIHRGNRDTMTLLHTGALTAGAAEVFTDAGTAFGVADEVLSYLVTVWDPADQVGTQQWFTIAEHDATHLYPDVGASPAPAAGWQYRVYKPAARVTGVAVADAKAATFEVVMPWQTPTGSIAVGRGPAVLMEFISVERAHGTTYQQAALRVTGGCFGGVGLVVESTDDGLIAGQANLICGTLATSGIADLVHGLAATDTKMRGASIGIRAVGGAIGLGVRGGSASGCPVVRVTGGGAYGIFVGQQSKANFSGGAVKGGSPCIILDELAVLSLRRGLIAAVPFRIGGTAGHSIRADGRSSVSIYTVKFDTIGLNALSGRRGSLFYLSSATTLSSVSAVTGYIIELNEQSQAILDTGITPLVGGLGELLADALVGTFANVITGTPLTGLGGSRVSRYPG